MKPILAVCFIGICLFCQSFLGSSRTLVVYPVFDTSETYLPRNFRTTEAKQLRSALNLHGLQDLKVSGSGQFSEKMFVDMMQYLAVSPKRLVVIDLRQESHGFINGNAVSWTDGQYNYGNLHKSKREIEADENQRLIFAARAKQIVINPADDPKQLAVNRVKTERDFVVEKGCEYLRMPVTDLNRPANEVVDQFVEYFKTLSKDQWVHFHCRAGKGRTTTFMTLLDIMKNGQQVELHDIIARQKFIGGSDLSVVYKPDLEKSRTAQERLEFVKKFYRYCRQVPDFAVSWSEWLEQQQSICANP